MDAKRRNSGNTQQNTSYDDRKPTPMEELEIALEECKFGRFHIRFLFTVLVSNIANVLVSANTAYILPNAECDLEMTIYHKGILNAMAYIGMLACGFFAGFLTDTFGRRVFLVYGYLGIFICCTIEGCSQNYETLLAAKFVEGIVFSAALNASIACTSEMTCKKIRDIVMLCSCSFVAFANVFISLLSWSILPHEWRFVFFDGAFVLSSWNIYLYVCGLFSLTACILFYFLPESPKYLVAHQRYKETMAILRTIYKENTRKPIESFSVKSIGNTSVLSSSPSAVSISKERTVAKMIVTSLLDIKPLFRKPLVHYLILICALQVMTMLVYNVLRLWYPQLSTIIEHYNHEHKEQGDLCIMLDSYMLEKAKEQANVTQISECIPNRSGTETYINSLIMGGVCIIPYIFTTTLVTRVGKKILLFVSLAIACGCVSSLGWASHSMEVVALVSTCVAMTQTSISFYQTIVVDVFPTVTKSLAISLMMMAGRVGTLTGNILFPILLAQGCLIPFISIAVILAVVMLLSMMLPSAGIPRNVTKVRK